MHTETMTEEEKKQYEADRPPILGSWKRIYALVLGNLVATILIFYLITRFYA
ncbi:hypothetical protein [Pontibacter qinzhouensis]|uniref:hypothetical protein n=1 Tax=Pontibacter qinzhouensis TaxID=2603253 RepID=UPI00164FCC5A|nr:hypothetical protein [Pontibacter qinzhouensis]